MEKEYIFKNICGHIEVYDNGGRFILSADSEREAEEDMSLLFGV